MPIIYGVGVLLRTQSHAPAAAFLAIPLCFVYALICLSAWYPSRALPPARESVGRIVVTHCASAAVAAAAWTGLAAAIFAVLPVAGTITSALPALFAMGFVLYLLAVASYYVVLAVEDARKAEAREAEARVLAGKSELRALKAQINPHFLYNSLNSISALTSIDPARARAMCVALADFLRLTLGMGEKAVIPLRDELGLLEKYCAIEKVRFGDRLTLQEEVDEETRDCLLPPLLLQPLFENAVVHGIAQMAEGGWIRLRAARNGDRLSLTVENSWDPEAGSSRKNGVGLRNVQRRLEARYGNEAQLQASAEENVFRVRLQFPAETEKKEVASG